MKGRFVKPRSLKLARFRKCTEDNTGILTKTTHTESQKNVTSTPTLFKTEGVYLKTEPRRCVCVCVCVSCMCFHMHSVRQCLLVVNLGSQNVLRSNQYIKMSRFSQSMSMPEYGLPP